MRENVFRKGVVLGAIFLFIGAVVAPNVISDTTSLGKTWYVDDNNIEGPWDGTQEFPYQHIKEAINATTAGDTVRVYNGTYYENIIIDKPNLKIIGNASDSTIINGSNECEVIKIITGGGLVENLCIRDSGVLDSGVAIRASDIIIRHSDIVHNFHGIMLNSFECDNITIEYSNISNNKYSGIRLIDFCENNEILHCDIKDNGVGIFLMDCKLNEISYNHIENNKKFGIAVQGIDSHNNRISNNDIKENDQGIICWSCGKNNILSNNLIDNNIQASFRSSTRQNWNGNYWQPRHLPFINEIFNFPIPYPIFGTRGMPPFDHPWINFDKAPSMDEN